MRGAAAGCRGRLIRSARGSGPSLRLGPGVWGPCRTSVGAVAAHAAPYPAAASGCFWRSGPRIALRYPWRPSTLRGSGGRPPVGLRGGWGAVGPNNLFLSMDSLNPTSQTIASTQHRSPGSAGGQHTGSDPLPEFLVIRSAETDESGRPIPLKLNPFQRHQAISKFGEAKQVVQRADGTLEVQLTKESDIRKLLSARELSFKAHGLGIRTIPVKVEPHPTKNSAKGIITCYDLRGVSEAEIVEGMEEQGVLAARRIRRRERGALVDTDSVILTFNCSNLPDRVKVGYLSVRVRLYIPDPIRCFKCQEFGHVSQKCNGQQRCVLCSEYNHEAKDCKSETLKCANCERPHKASDRKCEKFLAEQEVKALMVREKLTFRQAQAQVRAQRPAVSYRDVVARQAQPPPPRPPPRARGENAGPISLNTDMDTLLRDVGDLRNMSVGDFFRFVSQLVSGNEERRSAHVVLGDPALSREPEASVGSEPSPGRAGSLPQTSETCQETTGEEWTLVQGKRSGPSHKSVSAVLAPATSPSGPSPPGPAMQEALRRGEAERRAREAKRARLVEKAKEAKQAPGGGAGAAPPKSAPVGSTSSQTRAGGVVSVPGRATGGGPMGPPPPPQQQLSHPGRQQSQTQPPSPAQTPVSSPRLHAAPPLAATRTKEVPPAPSRPNKRVIEWSSPTEGETPRSRVKVASSTVRGRAASADSRPQGTHSRAHFSEVSSGSDTGEFV